MAKLSRQMQAALYYARKRRRARMATEPDEEQLPAPSNLTASQGEWMDRIELAWDPVDGVTGYAVFRDDSPLDEVSGTTYSDTTAVEGETYTYTVQSLPDGGVSAPAVGYIFPATTRSVVTTPTTICHTDQEVLGFSDTFTVSGWLLPATGEPGYLLSIFFPPPDGELGYKDTLQATSGEIVEGVRVFHIERFGDNADDQRTFLTYLFAWEPNQWIHFALAVHEHVLVYVNGELLSPTDLGFGLTDEPFLMGASPRRFSFPNSTFFSHPGHAHQYAVWNTLLPQAEIQAIYAAGRFANLNQTFGAYESQASLLHWWRPWHDLEDFGRDYAANPAPKALPLNLIPGEAGEPAEVAP